MTITTAAGEKKEVKPGGGIKCRVGGSRFSINAEVMQVENDKAIIMVDGTRHEIAASGIVDVIAPGTFSLDQALI